MNLYEINELSDDQIVATLRRDCGAYIDVIKPDLAHPLFRGMIGYRYDLAVIAPRVNRRPSDTSLEIHNMLNDYFNDKFGFPFRNGIFAVSDWHTAEQYGRAYIIFPIGDLHYLWHPNIHDLYEFIDKHIDIGAYNSDENHLMRAIQEALPQYTDKDLSKAIQVKHEVMFANKCYILTMDTYGRIKHLLK